MPGLFGGGGAPGAQTGSQVTPGGGLGGAASSGGLGMLNPYFSQLGPQEQKAAALRMAMANMGEMDFQGGVNAQQRPRTYGLGQLDAVVNESYDRAEREKAWMARERSEKQSEERYLTQQEQYDNQLERDARQEKRRAEEQMRQDEYRKANEERAREAAERQKQAWELQQQQNEEYEKLAEKYPNLNANEMARYLSLGGRSPSWEQAFGMGQIGQLGQGGPQQNPDDEIYRYGVGRVQR